MKKQFDGFIHTFSNGITFIHKQALNSRIAHCGFIFDIGSRDEHNEFIGIAHFWEHMAFKGTKKQSSFKLLSDIERVGGDLNAFTTKEKIAFHASIPSNHLAKATSTLVDISFHSVFPEKEIEKEKKVIFEELIMYKDSAEDFIEDEFESLLYKKHSLGYNILGDEKSIASFDKNKIQKFLKNTINTKRIVYTNVSPHSNEEALAIVGPYLNSIAKKEIKINRKKPVKNKPFTISLPFNSSQIHCTIGGYGPDLYSKDRLPMFLLTQLLAGPAMTSRMNMSLREKKGYVYSVESNFNSYQDTGFFNFYFATDPQKYEKALSLVKKEIETLTLAPISDSNLYYLKENVKGYLLMAEENNASIMQMMGKSWLDYNRIDTLETVLKWIDETTKEKLFEVAKKYLKLSKLSTLTLYPNT
jgi:predicted Zn-dependent peptidase